MAIIVVGGSNGGVGKTALVCGLVAALSEYRWAAVKVTTDKHPQAQSRRTFSPATQSHGRHSGSTGFRHFFEKKPVFHAALPADSLAPGTVWEETTPGDATDTGRYLAAGAARALLVSAPEGDLPLALDQLWPRFGRGTNIIFESNSVVHHVRANACLLIHAVAERALPLPERKPSFLSALRHADAMVSQARVDRLIQDGICLSAPEPDDAEPPALKPIFQLASLERVSPELVEWLRRKLEPSSGL